MSTQVDVNLSPIFFSKYFGDQLNKHLQKTSGLYTVREYKQEAPVDHGRLRRDVKVVERGDGYYKVTTTAKNDKGVAYPIFVHEGTYDYKGDRDYGYRPGARAFSFLPTGRKGIRPNKFAKRALEKSKPKIFKYLNNKIKKEI